MRNNPIINCIAGLVGIGALSVMYLSASGGAPPRVDSALHRAIGDAMARQTVALLKPGGQVIVFVRDTETFECPATDCQVEEFTKKLHKAGASITQLRRLKIDPLRIVTVPPGDFFDLMRKTPEGSVIVSFMGPPILNEVQSRQLEGTRASVVAFCSPSNRADLLRLFDQKLLQAAIVPQEVQSPARGSSTGQALFDQYYIEVTAANASTALPSPAGRAANPPAK